MVSFLEADIPEGFSLVPTEAAFYDVEPEEQENISWVLLSWLEIY